MEAWQIRLIIIGVIAAIFFFRWLINRWRNKARCQKALDKVAYDMLADFDFDKEKEEIKSIGTRYVSTEYTCPRCGGMLVVRNGRYGKFWGCNRYPNCRYTRRIK